MINDILKYRLDYTALALIAIGYIIFFLRNTTSSVLLLIATVVFGFLYLIWGVLHHARTHTLHKRIVLEYFLVSLLAVILVSTLLI